jgi:lipopolysaccharide export system protein LptA
MMRAWVVAAGLLGWAGAVAAQQIDLSSGGPVAITAREGFEWREAEQMVVASGDARAVRDNVTVIADRLIARYRKKPGTAPGTAPGTPGGLAGDSGGNEIYRLEAQGNVRIFTATDEAVGDQAIYDIDQAVMVMTGRGLKLTTPSQVLTARDSLEYWSAKRMAVARGNAVAVTTDAKRLTADVLVAFIEEDGAAPRPAAAPGGNQPPGANSKLKRMEAFGNVEARTQTDIVRGDRAVYLPETGVARVLGNVRVTSGQNQLNGPAADVNLRTGVARMLADPGGRVQGVIQPNSTPAAPPNPSAAAPPNPSAAAPPNPSAAAPPNPSAAAPR